MQNGDLNFARHMVSNALREIEKGDSVYEGLFNACTESLRWIDPDVDLTDETRENFENITQSMGCCFSTYDRDSVGRAVSEISEFSAIRIADEVWCLWVLLHGQRASTRHGDESISIVSDTAVE